MQAIRQRESVVDKKNTVEIPDSFGNEVEIIVLSGADEKSNIYADSELQNKENKIWSELTAKEFLPGYSDDDSIYDKSES
ncbi:MAG: hypothetical protein A2499_06440 [Stygiobacter sp. RIFOXYC12_FULL_38_8]|nr:MAG: hypothetical protein A2X62_11960 [Stygiobacter sp. GWC2_38_9]OGU78717.1 MAG: hypothetical protein A2279_09550 [Stygiobacter sp. RIFOXYA12_FULL_38_9]OGV06030.1 MAG: hypothetical protein A2299_07405 [Stygiobacter sp. RIFOXYB2_FULL_37_11]OGV13091.1 MAG: hypothetical protein A2237_18955 [Stygiobacter sp. RIFOXYA2_FULL_38_8]OGV16906.1 MAG: hypothetical protein A2440_06110 [Stygiobacter sp. RIFOXYC2_FULL_38_25]OGV25439.1 MAG: hypothetical protein A2499_06440 [Stygiobacter sp. RIFOXYC12_FULL_